MPIDALDAEIGIEGLFGLIVEGGIEGDLGQDRLAEFDGVASRFEGVVDLLGAAVGVSYRYFVIDIHMMILCFLG